MIWTANRQQQQLLHSYKSCPSRSSSRSQTSHMALRESRRRPFRLPFSVDDRNDEHLQPHLQQQQQATDRPPGPARTIGEGISTAFSVETRQSRRRAGSLVVDSDLQPQPGASMVTLFRKHGVCTGSYPRFARWHTRSRASTRQYTTRSHSRSAKAER